METKLSFRQSHGRTTLLLLPSVVAVMSIVGVVAAVARARRGVAVQPVEALRDE